MTLLNKLKFIFIFFLYTLVIKPQNRANKLIKIPSIISDNMVLQQNSNVPIWGMAMPNENVVVKAGWGSSAKTKVQPDSIWKVNIKTIKAGGPYQLTVTIGDSVINYKDVMLGEVWFCSGQSNMQIPLEGWPPEYPIKNSSKEIRNANYPNIRLFSVGRVLSVVAKFNCAGKWKRCTSISASKFSAVAYFFGKKLYQELHVPIGLICSAWGGTKIQPWISGKYLKELPEYKEVVEKINRNKRKFENLEAWIHTHKVVEIQKNILRHRWDNLNFNDSKCSQKNYNDDNWKSMKLPAHWSSSLGEFYGAVWFRKKIKIPQKWENLKLVLQLGNITNFNETWINGVKVGEHYGKGFYDIPKNITKDTTLTVTVRVIANGRGGGISGSKEGMKIYPKGNKIEGIPLSGEWKYQPVAEYNGSKFYLYGPNGEFYNRPKVPFQIYQDTPTAIFNGMVAPIIPYRIKGVIWYQGESNSHKPKDYENYKYLFPLLIKNWRNDWQEGNFPFYWVQIAPFNYRNKAKSYVIRNAQRQTLSVANTGMAVTLDIGSVNKIHPPDKQDVGLRLALWALDKNYGRHITFSGPLYNSMKVEKDKAIISFKYADGGLVIKPIDGKTNFIIAGRDSSFVNAKVKVSGTKLIVYNLKIKHPLAVRYAWSDADRATLFNKAGLPASTFRTDSWKP